MKNALIVLVGSGLGGMARHFFNVAMVEMTGTTFPWGILLINISGSITMGVMVGWFGARGGLSQELRLFLTTGVIGGFTTFSTFSLDTALLYERGNIGLAGAYVAASVVLSVAGLFLGMWAVRLALS